MTLRNCWWIFVIMGSFAIQIIGCSLNDADNADRVDASLDAEAPTDSSWWRGGGHRADYAFRRDVKIEDAEIDASIEPCLNRVCGEDPNTSEHCGDCESSEACSPEGQCINIAATCGERECGVVDGIECGLCLGGLFCGENGGCHRWRDIDGSGSFCGVLSDGSISCLFSDEERAVPEGDFTSLAVGRRFVCGITASTRVISCRGLDPAREDEDRDAAFGFEDGPYAQVVAGDDHYCGLREDGTVRCAGRDDWGEESPPAGVLFSQLSADHDLTCGVVLDSNRARCWGRDEEGQASPPNSATFTAVSAGDWRLSCGVRSNGRLRCWGSDSWEDAPETDDLVSVSVGDREACALHADGTLSCWAIATSWCKTCNPPGGRYKKVVSGGETACAIRLDDTLRCFGERQYGLPQMPPNRVNNLSASDGESTSGVQLEWDYVAGEATYTIYRDDEVIERGVRRNFFFDDAASSGTLSGEVKLRAEGTRGGVQLSWDPPGVIEARHSYTVRASNDSGSSFHSRADEGWRRVTEGSGSIEYVIKRGREEVGAVTDAVRYHDDLPSPGFEARSLELEASEDRPDGVLLSWRPPDPIDPSPYDYSVRAELGRDSLTSETVSAAQLPADHTDLRYMVKRDSEILAEGIGALEYLDIGAESWRTSSFVNISTTVEHDGSVLVRWSSFLRGVDGRSYTYTVSVDNLSESENGRVAAPEYPTERVPVEIIRDSVVLDSGIEGEFIDQPLFLPSGESSWEPRIDFNSNQFYRAPEVSVPVLLGEPIEYEVVSPAGLEETRIVTPSIAYEGFIYNWYRDNELIIQTNTPTFQDRSLPLDRTVVDYRVSFNLDGEEFSVETTASRKPDKVNYHAWFSVNERCFSRNRYVQVDRQEHGDEMSHVIVYEIVEGQIQRHSTMKTDVLFNVIEINEDWIIGFGYSEDLGQRLFYWHWDDEAWEYQGSIAVDADARPSIVRIADDENLITFSHEGLETYKLVEGRWHVNGALELPPVDGAYFSFAFLEEQTLALHHSASQSEPHAGLWFYTLDDEGVWIGPTLEMSGDYELDLSGGDLRGAWLATILYDEWPKVVIFERRDGAWVEESRFGRDYSFQAMTFLDDHRIALTWESKQEIWSRGGPGEPWVEEESPAWREGMRLWAGRGQLYGERYSPIDAEGCREPAVVWFDGEALQRLPVVRGCSRTETAVSDRWVVAGMPASHRSRGGLLYQRTPDPDTRGELHGHWRWFEPAYTDFGDAFGWSVALVDDLIAASRPFARDGAGLVDLLRCGDGGCWRIDTIEPPEGAERFGQSLARGEGVLVIADARSVHLYTIADDANWQLSDAFEAPSPGARFGETLAATPDGARLAISDPSQGEIHVLSQEGGALSRSRTITGDAVGARGVFAHDLAINGASLAALEVGDASTWLHLFDLEDPNDVGSSHELVAGCDAIDAGVDRFFVQCPAHRIALRRSAAGGWALESTTELEYPDGTATRTSVEGWLLERTWAREDNSTTLEWYHIQEEHRGPSN